MYESIPDSLPSKLSELIRVAVEDHMELRDTPGFEIDMDVWYMPCKNGVCSVCFAGGVIANRLVPNSTRTLHPRYFAASIADKLYALNGIRQGSFHTPASYFTSYVEQYYYKLPAYYADHYALEIVRDEDPDEWVLHMLMMAAILEAEGF